LRIDGASVSNLLTIDREERLNDPDDLKIHFEELKAKSLQKDASIYGGEGLWKLWDQFAQMHYEPAKEFFIERLEDKRPVWREGCLGLLGFDYKLEEQVMDKIRRLLQCDPDSGVRISAAAVLGSQGKYPEKTLVEALLHDSEDLVRESAFFALLDLADVQYKVNAKEYRKVKSGEMIPSLDQVRRVLSEQNLLANLDVLKDFG
jgi:hypothetical protein